MSTNFTSDFFTANRQKLYEELQPNSIVVLTANTTLQRSLDQPHRFEQEPNFWYFTGVDHADWLLLVDVDERREWLLAPHIAQIHQIFEGSFTPEAATRISGVEQVVDKREGMKLLAELMARKKTAYTLLPQNLRFYDFYPNPAQRLLTRKLKSFKGAALEDARLMTTRLRAIKQPIEQRALQKAIDITVKGIKAVIDQRDSLRGENEAEAVLTSAFRRQAVIHGFDPIVAAGHNATTIHYDENNAPFQPHDWLLMDVGARYDHYNADISRTIPLGKVTDRQRELYEALRVDQQSIIKLMQSGTDIHQYLDNAEQVLHDSFVRLGLVGKKSKRHAIYKVMPHAISHGLGYDTHDPLGRPDALLSGMVLTAEIGIYLPEEGFGVRLEDDIIVTDTGPRNMSAALSTNLEELLG